MTDFVKHAQPGPLLRNLQFSPLKQQDEQYVVLWDPTGLSSEKLIVPLNYFYLFQFFDGEHSPERIGAEYLKKFGEFLMPDRLQRLIEDLDEKLFLEGDRAQAARAAAVSAYRSHPLRRAAFAGKAYADEAAALTREIEGAFSSKEGPDIKPSTNAGKRLKAIVAPHYDPRQGGPIYAWAYKEAQEADTPDLFIVTGTCHAGLGHGYALTDKNFETPFGTVPVDRPVLDAMRRQGGDLFFEEDLSHQHEHSIEFQLPWLHATVGVKKPITIVPVLAAFSPEDLTHADFNDTVERFLALLKQTVTESGRPYCVIAGAELAHIGMRYGDNKPPTDFSFHKCMQADLEMLKHVETLDAAGFADYIRKEGNARRISGFAPIYTLLRLIDAEKGEVLRYDRGVTDQFNSTVTYAAVAFY
jgi:AmmeMemoRadiSam system protein B